MPTVVAKKPQKKTDETKAAAAFGQRLRELREAKGLTQQSLATLVGIHYQSLAKYEYGKNLPKWNMVEKIADALGVTTDAFRVNKGGSGE